MDKFGVFLKPAPPRTTSEEHKKRKQCFKEIREYYPWKERIGFKTLEDATASMEARIKPEHRHLVEVSEYDYV